MANRKRVRLSVSAAESNQRERNRGRAVSGKNVEEMEKGYAIQTKSKHGIIKPILQPRIELCARETTPSELIKRRAFFSYCVTRSPTGR